jgi:hypothetical protein
MDFTRPKSGSADNHLNEQNDLAATIVHIRHTQATGKECLAALAAQAGR